MITIRHARTHIDIVRGKIVSLSLSPIGRVILLEQKALYNVVNLLLDIYIDVCVNFDSPHTSHSLSIHTHTYTLS